MMNIFLKEKQKTADTSILIKKTGADINNSFFMHGWFFDPLDYFLHTLPTINIE